MKVRVGRAVEERTREIQIKRGCKATCRNRAKRWPEAEKGISKFSNERFFCLRATGQLAVDNDLPMKRVSTALNAETQVVGSERRRHHKGFVSVREDVRQNPDPDELGTFDFTDDQVEIAEFPGDLGPYLVVNKCMLQLDIIESRRNDSLEDAHVGSHAAHFGAPFLHRTGCVCGDPWVRPRCVRLLTRTKDGRNIRLMGINGLERVCYTDRMLQTSAQERR